MILTNGTPTYYYIHSMSNSCQKLGNHKHICRWIDPEDSETGKCELWNPEAQLLIFLFTSNTRGMIQLSSLPQLFHNKLSYATKTPYNSHICYSKVTL